MKRQIKADQWHFRFCNTTSRALKESFPPNCLTIRSSFCLADSTEFYWNSPNLQNALPLWRFKGKTPSALCTHKKLRLLIAGKVVDLNPSHCAKPFLNAPSLLLKYEILTPHLNP